MARTRKDPSTRPESGRRLVTLRKRAGLTQQELADALGVSRRVVAYYEGETRKPPATLLPALAKALGTSIEELVGGRKSPAGTAQAEDSRLLRRLRGIEKLPPMERRQVVQFIDAFLERNRLRTGTGG